MLRPFVLGALAALAALAAGPAAAGSPVGIAMAAAGAPAGAQLRVPLSIALNGNAPVSLVLRVDYDDTLLEPLRVDPGPAAAGKTVEGEAAGGRWTIVVYGTGSDSLGDAGVLAELVFALDAGAAGATTPLSDGGSDGADIAADPVEAVFGGGDVAIAAAAGFHSADSNPDWQIDLSELLRVVQFYNLDALSCAAGSEDGFTPGPGDQSCAPHASDYAPQDWSVSLSELLRCIQLYNADLTYHLDAGSEDGFAPGPFGG